MINKNEGDQLIVNKAYNEIIDLCKKYEGVIPAKHWLNACVKLIVETFKTNKFTYEEFSDIMDDIKDFYKDKWEIRNDH